MKSPSADLHNLVPGAKQQLGCPCGNTVIAFALNRRPLDIRATCVLCGKSTLIGAWPLFEDEVIALVTELTGLRVPVLIKE